MTKNTIIMTLDELNIEEEKIQQAAKAIQKGGLVVFPTETVYGLGADALNEDAVKQIFIAKGRPQDNPLIIHVADKDVRDYVMEVPKIAYRLMDEFWPGPLTIIFKKSHLIPDLTSAGLDTIGIRMPSNPIALELIKQSNVPIAAPSANLSGRPSPTELSRCVEDLDGKVDFIIGGNSSEVGLESTIIDCSQYPPCVLRPGGISIEDLKQVDENIYIDPHIMNKPLDDLKPKAPGMKYRHYAPKAPLKIISLDTLAKTTTKLKELIEFFYKDGKKVGVMATEETKHYYSNAVVVSMGSRYELNSIAKNLYETLRKLDDLKVDLILSEGFNESGLGLAIMNRLKKAAAYDVIISE